MFSLFGHNSIMISIQKWSSSTEMLCDWSLDVIVDDITPSNDGSC